MPRLRDLVPALGQRAATEIGPALVFFGVLSVWGVAVGTVAFIAATFVAVAVAGIHDRRLPSLPMVSALVVCIFGGLTLAYGDAAYVKMQPTITDGGYAAGLAIASLAGHNVLRHAFGSQLQLDDAGWRKLTWRTIAYLAGLAVANEFARRGLSTQGWAAFKAFVMGGLNIAFAAAQVSLVREHWQADSDRAG